MKLGLVYGHVSRNMGDLAINQGSARLIGELFPDADVRVVLFNPKASCVDDARDSFEDLARVSFGVIHTQPRDRPELFADYHDPRPLRRYLARPGRFLADLGLSDCDALLLASGDHLFSYSAHRRDPNDIDLVWRLLPALAAKSAGMRFVALPVTVGPNEVPVVTEMLRAFMSLCDALAVRDTESVGFAATLLAGCAVPALLDPAFFAEVPPPARAKEDNLALVMHLEDAGARPRTEQSRTAVHRYREHGYGGSHPFRLACAVAAAHVAASAGNIKLLLQSASADRGLASAIEEELRKLMDTERVRVVEPTSLSAYEQELSQTRYIVSSRLHTCVMALAQGKEVVGLHYDSHGHKMLGVFDMLEVAPRCLAVSGSEPGMMARSALSLLTQHQGCLAGLEERLQSLRTKMREWLYSALTSPIRVKPDARALAQLAKPFIRCMKSVGV